MPRPPWIQALGRSLRANRGAKAVALLLAIPSWYAIQAAISFETELTDIPLTIKVQEGWAIQDRSATVVDVVFRGPQDEIRSLTREQVQVVADVGAETFTNGLVVPLRPRNVQSPGFARPVSIRPAEVRLTLDQEVEKHVPVRAVFAGTLPDDVEMQPARCEPATVTLLGPRRRVQEIETVQTVPIDLEGRIQSFRKSRVGLQQPAENWIARFDPVAVAVEVNMLEHVETREWPTCPIAVLLRPGWRLRGAVEPAAAHVVVRGSPRALGRLETEPLRVYVDGTELSTPGQHEVPLRLMLPSGVRLESVEPNRVRLDIEESRQEGAIP